MWPGSSLSEVVWPHEKMCKGVTRKKGRKLGRKHTDYTIAFSWKEEKNKTLEQLRNETQWTWQRGMVSHSLTMKGWKRSFVTHQHENRRRTKSWSIPRAGLRDQTTIKGYFQGTLGRHGAREWAVVQLDRDGESTPCMVFSDPWSRSSGVKNN